MRQPFRNLWFQLLTLVVSVAMLISWCNEVVARERTCMLDDQQFQEAVALMNLGEAEEMIRFASKVQQPELPAEPLNRPLI